ncbi:MAG TPA: dihydrolipoamide acetyltransferase family protein [Mycobacteriales bacterium]|jgi:pyruvate dehydrogenase E2 component (dihydrolipoamide acetyltransferase)|nr:dihydrolipoamide acetyltransferase family protein [Mycobacteriales bacterium]
MAAIVPFRLPDLGEGLTEGHILRWLVSPGESVELNQLIVEVETAKAAVEVPSPYSGTVRELLHQQGDTVDVGAPIITFDVPSAGQPESDGAAESSSGRTAVLVGYGPKAEGAPTRRRRRGSATVPEPAPPVPPAAVVTPPPTLASPAAPAVVERKALADRPLAKPPVRKLARDLGIDLAALTPSSSGRVVTRDDVLAAANGSRRPTPAERERRIAVTGVRKLTAEAMVSSAFTVPHASVFLTVDMTATMELVAELKRLPEFSDVKVGPLLVAAKAALFALARNPELNAHWDNAANEIVQKSYVNLGIAVASPRGLLVPVINDAQGLPVVELARKLTEITAVAHTGHVAPARLSGGTFSISNVGVFGVDGGTPILPPGQGAILAMGMISPRPWVREGVVVPRQVMMLSLSFDHRMVDGAESSKFLADVGRFLANPGLSMIM